VNRGSYRHRGARQADKVSPEPPRATGVGPEFPQDFFCCFSLFALVDCFSLFCEIGRLLDKKSEIGQLRTIMSDLRFLGGRRPISQNPGQLGPKP